MDISTKVSIALTVLSFLLATLSIIFVVITIKQNNKMLKQNSNMIEASTRPYVVVFYDHIQTLSTIHEYLVLKNFGQSGAIIDSIEISPPFESKVPYNLIPFGTTKNTFIAPGQSFKTVIGHGSNSKDKCEARNFKICYHTGAKHYSETISINEFALDNNLFLKSSPSSNQSIQKVIAEVAEELFRRGL